MKVNINNKGKKSTTFTAHEMETGNVYDYSGALAQSLESGCIIVYDTNDETLVTFDDAYDLEEWLADNGYTKHGTLTDLKMSLVIE